MLDIHYIGAGLENHLAGLQLLSVKKPDEQGPRGSM